MTSQGLRIVTPEAVELDLDAAGLASRFLAAFLDVLAMYAVLWALVTVASLITTAASAGSDAGGVVAAVVTLVGSFAVLLVWPIAWEVGTKGRSLGKMALGLRVVTVEGAPIRLRHAMIRGLVAFFEIFLTFGVVAVCVALGSRRFRRLGDHLAGTFVLRERGAGAAKAYPRRFLPYPGWEEWASRLDTTRLTADDYRLVRSFLLRAPGLPEATRAELGGRILVRALGRAGIDAAAVPALTQWGVEPPLLAVAAAYQRRFDAVTVG
jgi:uncharacterized RDD family membrane protein YckC